MLPSEVRVGWIFRYAHLWDWQHREGREEEKTRNDFATEGNELWLPRTIELLVAKVGIVLEPLQDRGAARQCRVAADLAQSLALGHSSANLVRGLDVELLARVAASVWTHVGAVNIVFLLVVARWHDARDFQVNFLLNFQIKLPLQVAALEGADLLVCGCGRGGPNKLRDSTASLHHP